MVEFIKGEKRNRSKVETVYINSGEVCENLIMQINVVKKKLQKTTLKHPLLRKAGYKKTTTLKRGPHTG